MNNIYIYIYIQDNQKINCRHGTFLIIVIHIEYKYLTSIQAIYR